MLGGRAAGVIVEPLIQAPAGMIPLPDGWLTRVRELCDRHGTLLIVDEVATGFGRTGEMFACDHEGVTPDLMALANLRDFAKAPDVRKRAEMLMDVLLFEIALHSHKGVFGSTHGSSAVWS